MIQKEEEDKKIGKFISKKSKLISKVSIIDFSFSEISVTPATSPDNLHGNIIHARYHDEQEISLTARTPEKFNEELISKDMQAPPMVPVDFTESWLQQKLSRKKKASSVFENEEEVIAEINQKFSDIIGEEIAPSAGKSKGENAPNESSEQDLTDYEESPHESQSFSIDSEVSYSKPLNQNELPSIEVSKDVRSSETKELSKSEKDSFLSQDASMDYLSKQISNFNGHASSKNTPSGNSTNGPDKSMTSNSSDFIPMDTDDQGGLNEVDKKSIETYLSQKELEDIRQKAYDKALENIDIDAAVAESKSLGYEQGFAQGEAKASLGARAETERAMEKIGLLVEEFEQLKFNILENVQENFMELTQAVCEAVLDRTISLDPKKFSDLIKTAINQTIETDKFKIKVSESKYEQLKHMELGDLTGKFSIDHELADDQFKVDSDLTSVSSSVKQIILELLEKADLNLFEDEGPTSNTSDKVS